MIEPRKPHEDITDIELAFPAQGLKRLPKWEEIPDEFRKHRHELCRLVMDWFYQGIELQEVVPKDGIDKSKAFRHLKAIMGSFEPKHEHKIAGVAFLIHQWFDKFEAKPKGT